MGRGRTSSVRGANFYILLKQQTSFLLSVFVALSASFESFSCSPVLQLVKSQKMHAKLIIVVETEKEKILRKEFVFDDTKVSPLITF